ncbi:MAG: diguanylate cyclase [Acholeplasmataceae bacterium]|nr:diguanylate cyclase [Acholeplasmataceae bacterium]
MKERKYMSIIPGAKQWIKLGAVVYAFAILLFTIVIKRFADFSDLSSFAKIIYISTSILLILSVVLFYTFERYGAILSISFITVFNIASLIFQSVRVLDIQMNLIFVFGIVLLFLHYLEKAVHSERVDYLLLMNRYAQLELNSKITKTISEITPQMLINDNLDELLQTILEKAIELIPKAQSGSILIRNENRMEFRAAVGYDFNQLKKVDLCFEDMYQYKLGLLNEPAVIKDIKTFNKKNLKAEIADTMNENDMLTAKAVLTCSFILHGKIYGFINLDNLDDFEAFNEQDKLNIKHLASQIEIALNNHLLVEEIYTLSKTDSLTGVHSRKHHEKIVFNLYKEFRNKKKEFSIAVMDVNYLKQVNDTYGHSVGDQYLIHFARVIKEYIGENDIFSRTGGDEFVIVFPNKSLQESHDRIEKIREVFEQIPFVYEDLEHVIEFGCGVACYPKDDDQLMGLMRIADKRMYDDKRFRKLTR